MPSYQTAVDSRARQAQKEAKAKKRRQMAGMRDLAAIRRSPTIMQNLGIFNAPPFHMKGEVKSLDIGIANYAVNTTAVITSLNLIRAGSSFFNRIGRKIEMKSIHLKGYLNPVRTNAAADYARVMLVYDAQTNGTAPAIADILQDTDQAGTNATGVFSSANLNNRDRFKILCDYRIVLPSLTVTAGVVTNPGFIDPVTAAFDLERFVKLKGLVTQFKADSSPAVIGDIATGGLFLVTFGGTPSGSEGFQFTGSFRIRYTDN